MMNAQRLPVPLIPHQRLVPSMWYDVVDHCRSNQPALTLALNAQRVLTQEREPSLTPCTAIPSFPRLAPWLLEPRHIATYQPSKRGWSMWHHATFRTTSMSPANNVYVFVPLVTVT